MTFEITSTRLEFKLPFGDDIREAIVAMGDETLGNGQSADNFRFFIGPLFPNDISDNPYMWYFEGRDEDGVLDISYVFKKRPPGDIPEEIRKFSLKYKEENHYNSFLDLMRKFVPITTNAELRIDVNSNLYFCPALDVELDFGLQLDDLCESYKHQLIDFRFEGGVGGLKECEISYDLQSNCYVCVISLKGLLDFSSDIITVGGCNELSSVVFRKFFREK